MEQSVKRIIVLGGLGQFGRTAVAELQRIDLDAEILTASRRAEADLQIDAGDPVSLRANLQRGDVVLDAAGPFHDRSTALIEASLDVCCDVIDLNDDLSYAEAVMSLQPRIERAGIRVLSSASSVSAIAAAVVRQSGFDRPRRVTAFLVPASRHTSSSGAALSLVRCVGEPVRIWADGRFQEQTGWSNPRKFPMPQPIGLATGRLFESADAFYLPRIFPDLRDVAMLVDSNTTGVNTLLRVTARVPLLRGWLERHIDFCTAFGRWLGGWAGGLGYEIEDHDGRLARYAIVAEENSFLVAVAPAVLAARAIVGDRFLHRGLVLPDKHCASQELFDFLETRGLVLQKLP